MDPQDLLYTNQFVIEKPIDIDEIKKIVKIIIIL